MFNHDYFVNFSELCRVGPSTSLHYAQDRPFEDNPLTPPYQGDGRAGRSDWRSVIRQINGLSGYALRQAQG